MSSPGFKYSIMPGYIRSSVFPVFGSVDFAPMGRPPEPSGRVTIPARHASVFFRMRSASR